MRSRCHSTWDSFHSTFAGRDPAPLFFRDHAGEFDSSNVLAPAPLFLRSTLSLDATVQPSPQSPVLHPDTTLQINVVSKPEPHGQAVHNTLDDDTPRPLGDVLSHNTSPMTPLADPATASSSHPGNLSRSQSAPAPTPEMISERPVLIPRHSLSLPFVLVTERGLRLSPSVVARQPMPILNLPTLPPPSSPYPTQDSPPRRNVPLRNMPSLSRHGHNNTECQADHENATPVDSDEEEEEGEEEEPTGVLSVHQSDEEDEEPHSADLSGVHGIKTLQKRPMRDECFIDGTSCPQSEPTSSNLAHCFSSETHFNPIQITASPTSLAIHPFSPKSEPGDVNQRHLDSPVRGVRKPSLYHAASRSMIDLGVTRRTERGHYHLRSGEMAGTNLSSISGHTAEARAESEESDTEVMVGRLLRRTSMPSFHPTSEPPPYPTFNPRESRDMPPDDDEERLPPYSNSLYLIAVMPRKVEFTSPGVQARDRKWRRVVCELDGTAFRVYKCPPGASGAGVLGDWWEKRVGVGDVASPGPSRTRKKEEQFELPAKLGIDEAPAQPAPSGRSTPALPRGEPWARTESQSSIGVHSTTTPRATKRISGAGFLSPFRSSSSTRSETNTAETVPVEMHESHSSFAHESTGRSTPAAQRLSQPSQPRSAARLTFLPMGAGRAQLRNGEIVKPPQSDLIRAYTLQHAESGLGNDYLKRKNVIRVRLEGEQFLLQAPDTPAVVEWIEVRVVWIWLTWT